MIGAADRPPNPDEDPPIPLDLRLVPPAAAMWAGCAVGLRGGPGVWWTVVGCAAAGAVMLGWWLRHRRRVVRSRSAVVLAGTVAAVVVLGCACVRASFAVLVAERDPMVQAGDREDWATVDLIATGDPEPIRDRFGGSTSSDDNDGTGRQPAEDGDARDTRRWRLAATAEGATIRGLRWPSSTTVTVFGAGPGWADLSMGSRFVTSGTVGRDSFSILPGATLQAIGAPTPGRGPPWWMAWAVTARQHLSVSASVLPNDPGGLLRGLVVGDTGGIDDQLSDDAKTTGLTHLVAVSGSHVAVVCGLVVVLLRRFGPRPATAGAAVTLVGLVVLVGPQPSVLRAALMGAVGMLAVLVGRERAALPALAASVILLLSIDPSLALSFGFALSVQATAGLVLLAPGWTDALCRKGVPRGWAQLLVVPLAAQLATAPLIAALTGAVSLVSVPANIAAAPVVGPALIIGLLCCAVGPWWPAGGRGLARIDGPLLGWITGVAHRLARIPDATVAWSAGIGGVLALAVVLTVGALGLRSRRVRIGALAAALGALLAVVPIKVASPGWPLTGWLLTACEVGQGDGMVLSTGEPNTAVVVDTGPDPELMDACLGRLDVTTIPLLVLTHLHADHVGGLGGVLAGRTVDAIAVGPDREPAAGWRQVTADAVGAGVPVIEVHPGWTWAEADLRLTVLGPAAAYHGTDSDPNNDSVVLMAVDHGVRILMTGDIEKPAQQALLDTGVDLSAQVLKEPHHGSAKVLPAFLAAVDPEVSVIGVGAGNDYGQPSPTALLELADVGVATVLRTDLDGDSQVGIGSQGLVTAIRGPTLAKRTGGD